MKIAFGICGSIAAYRSVDLIKDIVKLGHEVQVIISGKASNFVSERVLSTVSGRAVIGADPFNAELKSTDHIQYARWADLFIVYAASANFLARYSIGLCDEMLELQLLAAECPVWVAPAMNPSMWKHAATQHACKTLSQRGVEFVGPIWGQVACGESGLGHVVDGSEVLAKLRAFGNGEGDRKSARELSGLRVLVTAGPMRSELDDVRFIQNRSSGATSLGLAEALVKRGAEVTIGLGPVAPEMASRFAISGVQRILHYSGVGDYRRLLDAEFNNCDVFISAAAVLDYQVEKTAGKWERPKAEVSAGAGAKTIQLKPVEDFVKKASLARFEGLKKGAETRQKVIAFSLETGDLLQARSRAERKMREKQVDAIVLNLAGVDSGPEVATNRGWILFPGSKEIEVPSSDKSAFGEALVVGLIERGLLRKSNDTDSMIESTASIKK